MGFEPQIWEADSPELCRSNDWAKLISGQTQASLEF